MLFPLDTTNRKQRHTITPDWGGNQQVQPAFLFFSEDTARRAETRVS